jgi:hypothetical protein
MGSVSARRTSWRIEGLAADGPHPTLRQKLMLFGQFVGDWEITEYRYLQHDGSWKGEKNSPGEIHWRWILEGRAIQDIWGHRDTKTHNLVPAGTTVRFYDSKLGAWRSTWLSPSQHVVRTFIGRLLGGRIVLDATDRTKSQAERWIFSQITPNSFRWHAEQRRKRLHEWVITEEMSVRRRMASRS